MSFGIVSVSTSLSKSVQGCGYARRVPIILVDATAGVLSNGMDGHQRT